MENIGERFIDLIESEPSLERIINDETGLIIIRTGGIESLLVCFAEVIRSRYYEPADVHSKAFAVLLHMSQKNHYYLTKFLDELNGLKLAEFILSHRLCKVSVLMLQNYLDFCLIKDQSNQFNLIKSSKLIFHLMASWRAWHKDVKVAKFLYSDLIKLLQITQPDDRDKVDHNIRMLSEAGGISILMDILRECLVPADDDVPNINHELIELIVNLITLLIRHPPGLQLMREVMDILIFLHPDHKAYVEPYVDHIAYMGNQFRVLRCSNRSMAIASIADMLASIVKLSSTDPMGILSEALQSSIIDPRKLIILANNGSHLVREKVLRLFLYCIRACYSLDLKSLLGKYEQEEKNSNFKLNLPIQLMARQLLRYPTTIKMVQLCYGIIVGIDDFESVDRICLRFNIDPTNNHLQLNTLVLLIQLANHLQTYREMILTLQFIHAYIKQLLEMGQVDVVLIIMKRTFVDSLMMLYFLCVEHKVQREKLLNDKGELFGQTTASETTTPVTSEDDEDGDETMRNIAISGTRKQWQRQTKRASYNDGGPDLNNDQDDSETARNRNYSGTNDDDYIDANAGDDDDDDDEDDDEELAGRLLWELDRSLILITRTYSQYLPTNEAIKAIGDLVLYFNSFNCHVPSKYKNILRDRAIRVLASVLRYCRHYEKFAQHRQYGGKLQYYLKSFFGNNELNSFSNSISESEFVGIFMGNLYYEKSSSKSSTDDNYEDDDDLSIKSGITNARIKRTNRGGRRRHSSNNFSVSSASSDQQYQFDSDGTKSSSNGHKFEPKEITESEVLNRFEATYECIVDFIITREPGIIPSPLERDFIMLCTRTFYRNLTELRCNSHWSMLLPKLGRLFRHSFSKIIIYLLSPDDSMNIDERRYFAQKLFSEFKVERVLELLEQDSARSTYILLLNFTKDLLEYSDADGAQNGEDCDEDCIENKLKRLIDLLEKELNRIPTTTTNETVSGQTISNNAGINESDKKFRSIWLADLNQAREDARERSRAFMEEKRANNNGIVSETLAADRFENDRLVDEAVNITRDVVNEKHELRKVYLDEVKQKKVFNYHVRQQWLSLIIGHTHERAIWHMKDYYPKSWELNPVEGPSRTRRRLRPCKLALEARFLRNASNVESNSSVDACRSELTSGVEALEFDNGLQQHRFISDCLAQSVRCDDQQSSLSCPSLPGSVFEPMPNSFDDDWHNLYSPHPLCSLVLNCNQTSMDSNELRIRMFTTDKIHFNCDCSIIRPNEVCEGEVSIASWCIHFIGERSDSYHQHQAATHKHHQHLTTGSQCNPADHHHQNQMLDSTQTPPPLNRLKTLANGSRPGYLATMVEDLWFDEIVEIWDRRYQLQDVGLELFLTNNMTYLFSFNTNRDREDFKHHLFREQHKMINLQRFNSRSCLNKLTRLWRDGKLTNFDYLTCLNKLAGRSFNDLMQYPIFPFVLANYTSDVLDLNKADNYRKLDRPMAVQNKEREQVFKENYNLSQASLGVGPLGLNKPYHYGNHYSNSATVLHFLVRLPPFTQTLIQYQDNNFDQPDRTFHSLANTWQLITRDSNTDFKELIPEFFFLPEMFTNICQLELGRKQSNELVDDVRLPPWCPQSDARLFTLIHRQALESAYVSENLHHWIDLIFGYRQTGKAAVEALNVFHPATYYGGLDLCLSAAAASTAAYGSNGSNSPAAPSSSAGGLTPSGHSSRLASLAGSSSLALINPSSLASARTTSKYDSDYISDSDGSPRRDHHHHQQQQQQRSVRAAGAANAESAEASGRHEQHAGSSSAVNNSSSSAHKSIQLKRHNNVPLASYTNQQQQADIERSALETMIKTYGQMPRQLFNQPVRQRSGSSAFNMAPTDYRTDYFDSRGARRIEPLRQVRGLRWGSYVGSPDEGEIIVVSHRTLSGNNYELNGNASLAGINMSMHFWQRQHDERRAYSHNRFHLCMLANGDVAILRKNSCLMLDYRADRKTSGGLAYQLSLPAAVGAPSSNSGVGLSTTSNSASNKHDMQHRAGLSSIARMNLFSNMIISRQHFSLLEPVYSPASQLDSLNSSSAGSQLASTLAGSQKARFSHNSLTLVSWNNKDALIQVKHPATSNSNVSVPLLQADTLVDKMTTCCSTPELNLLLVGYRSGAICAHIVSTSHELAGLCSRPSNGESQLAQLDYAAPSAIHFLNAFQTATQKSQPHGTIDASSNFAVPDRLGTLRSSRTISSRFTTLRSSPMLTIRANANSINGSSSSTTTTTSGSAGTLLQQQQRLEKTAPQASADSGQQHPSTAGPPPINRTSRWLYCHNKKINCIKINVSFGIVVTGSDDGTSVIWDLNSLTYLRTIDYKAKSLVLKNQSSIKMQQPDFNMIDQGHLSWNYGRANTNRLFDYICICDLANNDNDAAAVAPSLSSSSSRQQNINNTDENSYRYSGAQTRQPCTSTANSKHMPTSKPRSCCICSSGVRLISISDTLGDIATVKHFSDRMARASTTGEDSTDESNISRATSVCLFAGSNSTSASSLVRDEEDTNLTSVVYVHTINGSLVGSINCHTKVTALCYSNAPEGVSVNVIVVGMASGLVRLYSSWELNRIKEFRISDIDSPVSSILYSRDSQLLYITYDDDRMVVLRNKKKSSISKPKEWVIVCNKNDQSN